MMSAGCLPVKVFGFNSQEKTPNARLFPEKLKSGALLTANGPAVNARA
jgi:hypothetical protein